MKTWFGSVVFLACLVVLRQLLVAAGLPPLASVVFLAALVGMTFGGILFLESALDAESKSLRREVEGLRKEVRELRARVRPTTTDSTERTRDSSSVSS